MASVTFVRSRSSPRPWLRACTDTNSRSFATADGRVFVHARKDPEEVVTAFDLVSGKPLWTQSYQSEFKKNQYAKNMSKGPFSTPLVAEGRLFTLGTSAVLTSFDAATGAVKWRKDWSKDFDTSRLFTGASMSPIIAGADCSSSISATIRRARSAPSIR
ncbi:MAG: PQQ-binding-like beta-propeller repeat protein [Vicinamibacterales bacterium]